MKMRKDATVDKQAQRARKDILLNLSVQEKKTALMPEKETMEREAKTYLSAGKILTILK